MHAGPGALSASAAFEFRNDEQGPNDVPGQGDLTRFGSDSAGLPATLLVSWNWDAIALSGGNTGDACALFDTDNDGRVNTAMCVTIAGIPAAQTAASPRLYVCADTSVDRCTSSVPVAGFASSCTVSQSATDPFPAGAASPADTTATCTIVLADVGAGTEKLVNTCSYPSQVPNSNPTDCVLFPRDGFIVIDPEPAPGDSATSVPFTVDGDPTQAFTATGTTSSDPIPVRTDPAAGTHSIDAGLPAGSTVTGTCSDGSPISAIDVDSGETVTCTINYKLPEPVPPGGGFIVIDPDPARDDPRRDVPFTLDGDPAPAFTATGTAPSDPIPVRTDTAAGTHSLAPGLPAGSRVTASCSDGSPISAIDVDPGETVICTIRYELPDKLSVKAGTSAATAGAGSTVTITVAVTNRGPGAAGPMKVCVRLPPGRRGWGRRAAHAGETAASVGGEPRSRRASACGDASRFGSNARPLAGSSRACACAARDTASSRAVQPYCVPPVQPAPCATNSMSTAARC